MRYRSLFVLARTKTVQNVGFLLLLTFIVYISVEYGLVKRILPLENLRSISTGNNGEKMYYESIANQSMNSEESSERNKDVNSYSSPSLDNNDPASLKEFPGMPDPCSLPRRITRNEDILCMVSLTLQHCNRNPPFSICMLGIHFSGRHFGFFFFLI